MNGESNEIYLKNNHTGNLGSAVMGDIVTEITGLAPFLQHNPLAHL